MHAIFFGLKRSHHGTLRITRSVLARMQLTAARFDMLHAIKVGPKFGMLQSALRRVLGVSRATVSRMLESLEQLGLVMRKWWPHERRQRWVELTTLGRWRIAYAHRHITRSGWAQLAVDSALGTEESNYTFGTNEYHWYDQEECIAATWLLDGMLHRLRRAFFDGATLDYPWNPHCVEDFDEFYEALEELESRGETV
jgi:DNA-binding MarR family transcriptional regulator